MSGRAGVAVTQEELRPLTVQVLKTKAEQALSEGFAAAEAALPGNDAVRALRREAIGRFAALGLPHRRVEEWKYTDLRALWTDVAPRSHGGVAGTQAIAEALDGEVPGLLGPLDAYTILFADGALVTSTLPKGMAGVECIAFDAALANPPQWVSEALSKTVSAANGVLALNTAYMSGGVVLRIADGVSVDKPIHLVFQAPSSEAKSVATRVLVSVGHGSNVTVIESQIGGNRQTNRVTQASLAKGARLTHVKNLNVAAPSLYLAHDLIAIGADALYRPFHMTAGDGVSRNDISVTFNGQHSEIDLSAAVLLNAKGHADTTLVVDHAVPHCLSRELVKCVLDDRARAVFQGKVIVQPDAQKTDGKMMARALLLSPDAEFNSKPELEIYADDVVCGHGTTSMELDEDLLFYCQSRGIPTAEARTLLVESFIGEAIDRVEHTGLRDALMAKARSWLTANGA